MLPPGLPGVAPGLAPPSAGAPVSPEAGPRLQITSVGFEGVTAYPQSTLHALTGDRVGPAIPAGRIELARRAILDRCRRDGYVYTA